MRGRSSLKFALCGALGLVGLGVVGFGVFGIADVVGDVARPSVTAQPLESVEEPDACSPSAGPETSNKVSLAIEALEWAQSSAESCGVPDPDLVVCRGLWAAWVLDPVVVASVSPSKAEQAQALSSWALEQAAAAANDELAVALRELSALNDQLSDPALADASRAELIRSRAVDEIVVLLRVAEEHCNESVGR